ncbi:hypothetical protein [Paenibacillus gorillae]|uniref:hypothetical protein n=1 Tax=Paenibacillus gorillae TaxID=1243662 RepID=UPI0005A74A62|nr:hypothetical protein [Paenibacillus gorillae]
MLVSNDQTSLNATRLLLKSSIWQGLSPVQRNLVYRMHAEWNYDDSITREQLLTALPDVLSNKHGSASLKSSRS